MMQKQPPRKACDEEKGWGWGEAKKKKKKASEKMCFNFYVENSAHIHVRNGETMLSNCITVQ